MNFDISVEDFISEVVKQLKEGNVIASIQVIAILRLYEVAKKLPDVLLEGLFKSAGISVNEWNECMQLCNTVGIAKDILTKEASGSNSLKDNIKEKILAGVNGFLKKESSNSLKNKEDISQASQNKSVPKSKGVKDDLTKNDVIVDKDGKYVFADFLSNGKLLVVEDKVISRLRPGTDKTVYYSHLVQQGNGFYNFTQKMEAN